MPVRILTLKHTKCTNHPFQMVYEVILAIAYKARTNSCSEPAYYNAIVSSLLYVFPELVEVKTLILITLLLITPLMILITFTTPLILLTET